MKKIYTRDQHKHSDAEQRLVSSQEPDLSKRGKGGGGGVACLEHTLPLQKEDAERRAHNLEEAKSVTIKQDPSLPQAQAVSVLNALH